jgi:hypothetical protein
MRFLDTGEKFILLLLRFQDCAFFQSHQCLVFATEKDFQPDLKFAR